MKAWVVTTDKRGVFFGYASEAMAAMPELRLERARMCVYWDVAAKGVLGLAAAGPTSGSRITDAVPSISLCGITSVMEASPQAVTAWERGIWK